MERCCRRGSKNCKVRSRMMVLLNQKEYNDLVAKGQAVEAQVEQRLGEVKRELLRNLQKAVQDNRSCSPYGRSPVQTIAEAVEELLR